MGHERGGTSGTLQTMLVSFVVAGAAAAAVLFNVGAAGRGNAGMARLTRESPPDESGNHLTTFNTGAASAPEPAPVVAAGPSAAPVPAAPLNSWIRHIRGFLVAYDIHGPATQPSQTSASVPTYVDPSITNSQVVSVAANPATRIPASPSSQPTYIKYGTTSRADIMSGASGPVYNFTGKQR